MKFTLVTLSLMAASVAVAAENGYVTFFSGPDCNGQESGHEPLNQIGEGHCFDTRDYRSFRASPACRGHIAYNGWGKYNGGDCAGDSTNALRGATGDCLKLPNIHNGAIIACLRNNNDTVEEELLQ